VKTSKGLTYETYQDVYEEETARSGDG